jgi:hypothetical protein
MLEKMEYWNNGIKKQKKSIPLLRHSFPTQHSSIPIFWALRIPPIFYEINPFDSPV